MSRGATCLAFIKQHSAECICLLLLIVLAVIGFSFHEITYDEAQAWQIARTASWKDIVFLVPIYEGHPPFWHLLLAGPAKWGFSWHLVYSLLGFSSLLISASLLLFKSPFPRWVRCLLPFSFFLFYQYIIIVRPYCLIMPLVFLLAIYFPQKDKRPGLFVGLLAALCACHLYGIAIAGGITLAWLWQMREGRPWKVYLSALFKDRRFHYLLGLLTFVLLIIVLIVTPRAGEHFVTTRASSTWQQLLYLFLAMPADAVLTDLNTQIRTYTTLLPLSNLLITAGIGLLLWIATFVFFPRRKVLFLVLPYLCMALVMINYSSCHHIGLALLLFVWYLWITLADDKPITAWPKIVKSLATGLLLLMLLIPTTWNLYALYNDYRTITFDGKRIVSFLQKYNLMDENIFAAWQVQVVPPSEKPGSAQTDSAQLAFVTSPLMQPVALMLNVFLDHNIIANFNNGDQDKGYLINRALVNPEQREKVFKQWAQKGLPTVTIDMPALDVVFPSNDELTRHYRTAYMDHQYRIWKLSRTHLPITIYLQEELWQKYGPQILADQGIDPVAYAQQATQHQAPVQSYAFTLYR